MTALLLAAQLVTSQPTSALCLTVQPGPQWVCVNGGWLPPGHPAIPVTPEPPPPVCEPRPNPYLEPDRAAACTAWERDHNPPPPLPTFEVGRVYRDGYYTSRMVVLAVSLSQEGVPVVTGQYISGPFPVGTVFSFRVTSGVPWVLEQMRPVIRNRPQLGSVLADTLDGIVSPIQRGWNTQHMGDGTHTDITATSASITGLTTLGKVRLRSTIFNDTGAATYNNLTTPDLKDVSWLRIFPSGAIDITGIDATGRELGDLLLVTFCDSGGVVATINLLPLDVRSTSANQFSLDVGGGTTYVLEKGRGVWLIYDYDVTSFSGPRVPHWRIIGTLAGG